MTTPAMVLFDPEAPPQAISPMVDYSGGTSSRENGKKKSRKNAVDMQKYNEIKRKYQGAKKRVDRLKQERQNNRRMLLEMSSVISALKDISIDYEPASVNSGPSGSILNIHNKIRAIDTHLKKAVIQCRSLTQENEIQSSTIMEQHQQLELMEAEIHSLRCQLNDAVEENRRSIAPEKKTLDEMHRTSDVVNIIQAQQGKIGSLENQVMNVAQQKKEVDLQIEALRGSHKAKYTEILAMEKQLKVLREAQKDSLNGFSSSINCVPAKQVSFTPDALRFKLGLDQNQCHSFSSNNSGEHSSSNSNRSDRSPSIEQSSEDEGDVSSAVTVSSVDDDISADEGAAEYSLRSAAVPCDLSGKDESVDFPMPNAKAIGSNASLTSEETQSSRSPAGNTDYAEE
jgi:myosin heavy subunit